ncbi:MAG: cbb3-type cytochrome oxidase assembly protein CcoS [Chromatiaceae bacterium]|nr:cbb3-type cytochrome oxidase assembly protein CcoS [Gammaproteobacteria bacterium]MCP5307155.1 cbb3-type cytochrome oxidase assembly protein CcoS [Chromatiaceae bacterium]MCP5313280.1 cbb3-type cytochrome oxidase assembly protein CcoS [Chromatiaceae bacterium]
MTILYLLIPLAVGLMIVAVGFFLWTVRTGQYDDLEGPAHRILMDDDDPMIPGKRQPPAAKPDADSTEPEDSADRRE